MKQKVLGVSLKRERRIIGFSRACLEASTVFNFHKSFLVILTSFMLIRLTLITSKMSQANNEIDKNFAKMVKSARAYSRDRGKNMGYLDTIVSEFLGKLKEMKLEPLVEKEIKSIIGNILKFTTGPSQSEILPGEVDWLLLRCHMPLSPKPKARPPEEMARVIITHQAFRGVNALSPDFMKLILNKAELLEAKSFRALLHISRRLYPRWTLPLVALFCLI